MAIQNSVAVARATGTGSATVFSFSPVILLASVDELHVYEVDGDGNEVEITTGITKTVSSFPGTGSVTFTTAPADGTEIVMRRVLEINQLTRLFNQGAFDPAVIERALDKLTLIAADNKASASRDGVSDEEVNTLIQEYLDANPLSPRGTSAFAFRAAPVLDASHSASNDTIPAAGAGLVYKILDDEEISGPIYANNDFFTKWEGFIEAEIQTSASLHVCLRTIHAFGENFAKALTHEREFHLDAVGGTRLSVPMETFNSVSHVRTGTVGGVTITQEDLNLPSKITYEIELTTTGRKNTTRAANRLDYLSFERIETISYQLGGFESGAPRLSDEQIGDKAFKNPPSLSDAQKRAVTSAVDAATVAQARFGVFELSSSTDRTVQDSLHLNEKNVPGIYPEGTKYYVDGGTAGGLKGKLIRRTGEAFGSVSEQDFSDNFSDYWETILDEGGEGGDSTQAELNAIAIGTLEAKSADLHAGDITPTGWQDAGAADGGLDRGPGGSTQPNQAYARAVSAWTQEVNRRGSYLVARILSTLPQAQARVRYTSRPTSSGRILRETFLLSSWRKVGESSDGKWTYYVNPRPAGTAVASFDLEVTSDSDHVGTSRFSGVVDGSLDDGIVDDDALNSTVKGKLDGALQRSGGTMTGKIVLDGAPTANLHAATKKYVDDNVGVSSAVDGTARAAASRTYETFTVKTADYDVVKATDRGDLIWMELPSVQTSNITLKLPSLGTSDAGWFCGVYKQSDANAGGTVTVTDNGGTQLSQLHNQREFEEWTWGGAHWYRTAQAGAQAGGGTSDATNALALPNWADLSGTIKKGTVVQHNEFPFMSKEDHQKQSTGPDGDQSRWWDLDPWWGVLSLKKFYPEGAKGKTGAGNTLKLWVASEFILDTDPLPFDAANTKWKLLWSAEIGRLPTETARLKLATNDIIVGEKIVPGWANVASSGAEGGLWASQSPSISGAKAATYTAPTLAAGQGGAFMVARIPTGDDPRQFIMREPSSTFGNIDTHLNEINHIGGDAAWDYYENAVRLFGNISLLKSSHTTGVNTWDGKLGPNAGADRIPAANPGQEQVWATDQDGTPAWRNRLVGGGSGGGGGVTVLFEENSDTVTAADAFRTVTLSRAPEETEQLTVVILGQSAGRGTRPVISFAAKAWLDLPATDVADDNVTTTEAVLGFTAPASGDISLGSVVSSEYGIARVSDTELAIISDSAAFSRVTVLASTGGGGSASAGGGFSLEEIGSASVTVASANTAVDTTLDVPDDVADNEIWAASFGGERDSRLQFFPASEVTDGTDVAIGGSIDPDSAAGEAAGAVLPVFQTGNNNNRAWRGLIAKDGNGNIVFVAENASFDPDPLTLYRVKETASTDTHLRNHPALPNTDRHNAGDLAVVNDVWYELTVKNGAKSWEKRVLVSGADIRGKRVKELIGTLAGAANMNQTDWTVHNNHQGRTVVEKANYNGNSTDSDWLRFSRFYANWNAGYRAILVEVERNGNIVSAIEVPIADARLTQHDTRSHMVGFWQPGTTNTWRIDMNGFHVTGGWYEFFLTCAGPDATSTIKVYIVS